MDALVEWGAGERWVARRLWMADGIGKDEVGYVLGVWPESVPKTSVRACRIASATGTDRLFP